MSLANLRLYYSFKELVEPIVDIFQLFIVIKARIH